MTAHRAGQRGGHLPTIEQLFSGIQDIRELTNGYSFQLANEIARESLPKTDAFRGSTDAQQFAAKRTGARAASRRPHLDAVADVLLECHAQIEFQEVICSVRSRSV